MNIFRRPITADTTIQFLSKRPLQQKIAAYGLNLQRAYTLPLPQQDRNLEPITVLRVAQNNGFPKNMLQRLYGKITQKREIRINPTRVIQTKIGLYLPTTARPPRR